MIYGIGTDIVAVVRIKALYQRYGEVFARKILSQPEWLEWGQIPPQSPENFLAKRFCAKEAISKALRTGLRIPVSLANISIVHDEKGRPECLFSDELDHWLKERGIHTVHLSLSDDADNVLAFAVAEYD